MMPAAAPSPQWASPRNVDTSPLEEDGNGRNTQKLRVSQAELAGSYEALYSRLNPRAGVKAAARRAKVNRLTEPRARHIACSL
jgi:hypothetical protein